jgi:hypothetical protein
MFGCTFSLVSLESTLDSEDEVDDESLRYSLRNDMERE